MLEANDQCGAYFQWRMLHHAHAFCRLLKPYVLISAWHMQQAWHPQVFNEDKEAERARPHFKFGTLAGHAMRSLAADGHKL